MPSYDGFTLFLITINCSIAGKIAITFLFSSATTDCTKCRDDLGSCNWFFASFWTLHTKAAKRNLLSFKTNLADVLDSFEQCCCRKDLSEQYNKCTPQTLSTRRHFRRDCAIFQAASATFFSACAGKLRASNYGPGLTVHIWVSFCRAGKMAV